MIKLFIWNHFIEKYFKDWLDDYVQEMTEEPIESNHKEWSDLD